MIEIALGSLAVIIITGLLVLNVLLRIKVSQIVAKQLQDATDKNILSEELNRIRDELETLKLQESDGFVKFLSESREWAFSYIDDVQLSIQNLKDSMDSGDSQSVLESFNQLIKFLPKEENMKES